MYIFSFLVISNGKSQTLQDNATSAHVDHLNPLKESEVLGIGERYRRLIPYMTFYLTNDYLVPETQVQRLNSHDEPQQLELQQQQQQQQPQQQQRPDRPRQEPKQGEKYVASSQVEPRQLQYRYKILRPNSGYAFTPSVPYTKTSGRFIPIQVQRVSNSWIYFIIVTHFYF